MKRHNKNKSNSAAIQLALVVFLIIALTLCVISFKKNSIQEKKHFFPLFIGSSEEEAIIFLEDSWDNPLRSPSTDDFETDEKHQNSQRSPTTSYFFKEAANDLFTRTIENEELKIRKIKAHWRGSRAETDPPEKELEFFMVDMSQKDRGEDIIKYIITFEEEVMVLFDRLLQRNPCAIPHPHDGWRGVTCEENFGNYEPIVLDIGANAGFYGLFSAKLGWEVLSIEPQPHCHQWIVASALMNGFSDRYQHINALASNSNTKISIPQRTGCWGTWPHATESQDYVSRQLFNQSLPDLEVGSVSVDNLLLRTNFIVPFMKVDTEGHERHVLESAMGMIKQGRILNIFVELGFLMWPKIGESSQNVKNMLLDLMLNYGYQCKCYCLGTWDINNWDTPQEITQLFHPDVDIVTTECWLHLPLNRRTHL